MESLTGSKNILARASLIPGQRANNSETQRSHIVATNKGVSIPRSVESATIVSFLQETVMNEEHVAEVMGFKGERLILYQNTGFIRGLETFSFF